MAAMANFSSVTQSRFPRPSLNCLTGPSLSIMNASFIMHHASRITHRDYELILLRSDPLCITMNEARRTHSDVSATLYASRITEGVFCWESYRPDGHFLRIMMDDACTTKH